jgi:hypothetical protein
VAANEAPSVQTGGTGRTGGTSRSSIAFPDLKFHFNCIFSLHLHSFDEDAILDNQINPNDPHFLVMANTRSSDITDFREKEYAGKKKRLDR